MPRKVLQVFVRGDVSVLKGLNLPEITSSQHVFQDWHMLEVEVDGGDGADCRRKLQEIVDRLRGLGLIPAQSPNYR